MRENLRLGLTLFIITAVAGLLLSFTNIFTKDAIAENKKITKEDLAILLPGADTIEDFDGTIEGTIKEIYKAKAGEEIKGYIFKTAVSGFHGEIELMVAVDDKDKLGGIKVLSHSETPGLGAKITEEKFNGQFSEVIATKGVNVVKTESETENDIEAISGATTSSKAVATSVNDVIKYYNNVIKNREINMDVQTDVNSGASESK